MVDSTMVELTVLVVVVVKSIVCCGTLVSVSLISSSVVDGN